MQAKPLALILLGVPQMLALFLDKQLCLGRFYPRRNEPEKEKNIFRA